MFENYKDSLFNSKTIMRSQLRFKSDLHNVYTEEVNKIALNSNDNKRLQTFNGITTYPYGANASKVFGISFFLWLKRLICQLNCIITKNKYKYK